MGWDQGWNILILWRFTEKSDFKGGIHKKPIYRGELPEKVGLEQFGNLRRGGGLAKKRGVDTPMHSMILERYASCI